MANYRDGRDRSFVMHPQGPEQVIKVPDAASSPGEAHEFSRRGNENARANCPGPSIHNLGTGI
jgi:hypothetical protein